MKFIFLFKVQKFYYASLDIIQQMMLCLIYCLPTQCPSNEVWKPPSSVAKFLDSPWVPSNECLKAFVLFSPQLHTVRVDAWQISREPRIKLSNQT